MSIYTSLLCNVHVGLVKGNLSGREIHVHGECITYM